MSGIIGNAGYSSGSTTGILARPGVGSTVQVVKRQVNSGHERSNSTSAVTGSSLSHAITTKFSNTAIKVEMTHYGTHCQPEARGKNWIQRAITGGATTQIGESTAMFQHHFYGEGNRNVANYEALSMNYIDEPAQAAGTTITYSARFYRGSTGGGLDNYYYFCHNGYLSLVWLTEIII